MKMKTHFLSIKELLPSCLFQGVGPSAATAMSQAAAAGATLLEGQSKTKTKRFKVKHPKRKLFRASDPLLSVFMWGVNHSVQELQHVHAPVMLMPDDFRSFSKVKVDNNAFNKENLPSHFKAQCC